MIQTDSAGIRAQVSIAKRGSRIIFSVVLARPAKILVVIALVLTTGLHWAVLQTVAWGAMLANNLRSESLTCAVSQTFDGAHPCCLCKAIAAAKQSQKKSDAVAATFKMEFPVTTGSLSLFPPQDFLLTEVKHGFAEVLAAQPPVPPPRLLPA
jgi:hypothetical protein